MIDNEHHDIELNNIKLSTTTSYMKNMTYQFMALKIFDLRELSRRPAGYRMSRRRRTTVPVVARRQGKSLDWRQT